MYLIHYLFIIISLSVCLSLFCVFIFYIFIYFLICFVHHYFFSWLWSREKK